MVGDRAKSHAQIVNLHFLLSQSVAGLANPTDGEYFPPSLVSELSKEGSNLSLSGPNSSEEEPKTERLVVLQEGFGIHFQQEEARE
jgi:hypothetical protein